MWDWSDSVLMVFGAIAGSYIWRCHIKPYLRWFR